MNLFIDRLTDFLFNTRNLIFVVLCGVVFFMYTCGGRKQENASQGSKSTKLSYFYRYDTTLRIVEVKKYYPVKEIIKIPVNIQDIEVDANIQNLINEYYSQIVYERVLLDDSTALIKVRDTVYMNGLNGALLSYINRKPTQINVVQTTEITPARNKVYLGGFIGCNVNLDRFNAGVSIMLNTKKDKNYIISVDPFNKSATFGINFKISFRNGN